MAAHDATKVGGKMRGWRWLCVLCASLSLIGASAWAEDCALKEAAELDLIELPDGIYAIPVSIGGTTKRFGLDLGSAFSHISTAAVDELKLERDKLPWGVKIFEGKDPAIGVAHLSELKLDRATASRMEFIEFARITYGAYLSSKDSNTRADLAGTLGLNLLANFDVDLDLSARKLRLFSQEHCRGQVVYWASSYASVPFKQQQTGVIMLHMTLDGKDIDVGLDSSGRQSVMAMSTAHRLFGIDESTPGVVPVPNEPGDFRYPFKTLSIGGLSVENPDIVLRKDDPPKRPCKGASPDELRLTVCFGDTDVRLVATQLRALHLYFAFKERVLYLTATDAK